MQHFDNMHHEFDNEEMEYNPQPSNNHHRGDMQNPHISSDFFTIIGNAIVSWFTSLNNVTKNFGFRHVILTMIVIFIGFIMYEVGRAVDNQNLIEQLVQQGIEEKQKHSKGTEIRLENSPKISKIMTRMLYDFDADKVCLFEFHNGKENGTGLPFMYADMTIEDSDNKSESISEYQNLNLSNYSLASYIIKNTFFCGSIEEFKLIDKKMGSRLEGSDVKYIIVVLLKTNIEIGFITITFKDAAISPELLQKYYSHMINYTQRIDYLLDYNRN